MKNPLSTIWDDLKSCELALQYPELPKIIRQSVQKTIISNPSRCLDPIKAKGQCLRMSDELMLNLSEKGTEAFKESKIIFAKKPHPHFWIYVDGWHIDLTARQFNPVDDCPKIWRHDDTKANNLFSVEKGKGLILFKLVPFHNSVVPAKTAQRLLVLLKTKLQQSFELFGRPLNVRLRTLFHEESSFR